MTEKRCSDCYFMYWIDEEKDEMNCSHGHAIPENGAPEVIDYEPNDCPFYEPRDDLNDSENKRFGLAYEQGNWWAVRDGDITLWKEEVIHLLNEYDDKNKDLQDGYEEYRKLSIQFKQRIDELIVDNTFLKNENQELEKEIEKYHKYIQDVKREELDRIFKMSIYEIAEAFEYYKERIADLERRLQE